MPIGKNPQEGGGLKIESVVITAARKDKLM